MARILAPPKPRTVYVQVPSEPPPAPDPAPPLAPPRPLTAPATDLEPPPADLDPGRASERSLLRRATGRSGTVLTSWRGLLAPGAFAPRRKSLLGE